MRSLLICHHDAILDREGLPRWMASFSDVVGVVVIRETRDALKRRVRRQLKRTGLLRFLDVLAFRFHYKLFAAKADAEWEQRELARLRACYPEVETRTMEAATPNSDAVRAFIEELGPDIVIASTKFMLSKKIYAIPAKGTFVLHPGICPQYRNSHGCFWALCERDVENVGVTLLRIDDGIDTGPVFGFYKYDFDEVAESHHRIQVRCLTENLDQIGKKFTDIVEDRATPLSTEGKPSATWGQPWLTRYLKWKRSARSLRNP